jgi:hypothetical protein
MGFPVGPGGFAGVGGMFIMRRGIEFLGHETLLFERQRRHAGEVPETRPKRDAPQKTPPQGARQIVVSHASEAWSAVESNIGVVLFDLRI